MPELSGLVSEDSRKPIERLRRHQLWQIAEAAGITYPQDAPKTVMVALLDGAGVDVTKSTAVQWQGVQVQDEKGNSHIEPYPVIPEHASAGKQIDYDAELAKRVKENEAKDEKIENQDSTINKLLERLEALENNQPVLPLKDMLPWQLQRLCKEQGIDTKGLDKAALIEALGG